MSVFRSGGMTAAWVEMADHGAREAAQCRRRSELRGASVTDPTLLIPGSRVGWERAVYLTFVTSLPAGVVVHAPAPSRSGHLSVSQSRLPTWGDGQGVQADLIELRLKRRPSAHVLSAAQPVHAVVDREGDAGIGLRLLLATGLCRYSQVSPGCATPSKTGSYMWRKSMLCNGITDGRSYTTAGSPVGASWEL